MLKECRGARMERWEIQEHKGQLGGYEGRRKAERTVGDSKGLMMREKD